MISVHLKDGRGVSADGVRLPPANGSGEINLDAVELLRLIQQLTHLAVSRGRGTVPCICSDAECQSGGCKVER